MLAQTVSDDLDLVLLEPRHAAALFVLVDSNRTYLRNWLPWVDATRSPEDTAAFIQRTQQQFGQNNGFQTALVHQGNLAGVIGHIQIDWPHRATSLGYWLAERHQGRALMTRACEAYLEHAFNDLGLNRVEIRVATGNRRSRAIPERLGFQLEGTLRQAEWLYDHFVDHALYGLVHDAWREHKVMRT